MQDRGKGLGQWRVVHEFVRSRHSAGYQQEVYDLLWTQAVSRQTSSANDAVARPEECSAEADNSSFDSGELIHVP
jgi:hypothetical protein